MIVSNLNYPPIDLLNASSGEDIEIRLPNARNYCLMKHPVSEPGIKGAVLCLEAQT